MPAPAGSPHPFLRAYMAGITIPTLFLLAILAAFLTVHGFQPEPLPMDRVLVFPMAIAPNLWGAWNMLYVALRRRRDWPLGRHGILLALLVGSLAWTIARAVGLPTVLLHTAIGIYPFVVVAYYLLWKYGVCLLNETLGIA
jgi:hypothetical protein